ncbi:MAG: DUF4129 domain-containing protein [Bacteroidota bacterium]
MNLSQLIYRMYRYILAGSLLGSLATYSSDLIGQQTDLPLEIRQLNEAHLEDYRQDKAFQYGQEPGRATTRPFRLPLLNVGSAAMWKTILYTLLILIIAGLVMFIIRHSLGKSSKEVDTGTIPALEDLDIRKVDLPSLLDQSIEAGQYRDAVRLMYLQILKTLSDKEWIDWKPHKTNYAYEQEMSRHSLSTEFSRLTLNFEYIWYGNYPINLSLFSSLQQRFQNFHQQLSQQ